MNIPQFLLMDIWVVSSTIMNVWLIWLTMNSVGMKFLYMSLGCKVLGVQLLSTLILKFKRRDRVNEGENEK